MNENRKKRDLYLITGAMIFAGLVFFLSYFVFSKPAVNIQVAVDGVVLDTLDLNQDTEMTIEGYNGGRNHLVIRDKHAFVDQATCPDKVCVHQGSVSRTGEIIVCLPNRVTVQILGDTANQ